jgi:hypothetical protein
MLLQMTTLLGTEGKGEASSPFFIMFSIQILKSNFCLIFLASALEKKSYEKKSLCADLAK